MQAKRIPRNLSTQSKKLELSDLNDDVLFEILLSFVAIDWDGGPFTLLLVCPKWQEMVLSKPRLWTWILVDDSQTDWKERMEVAADLSRALPLQIRLRLPFASDIPISHIVCRCELLFVESPRPDYDSPLRNWESETIVSDWGSSLKKSRLKYVSDCVMHFFADMPANRIKILTGERNRHCFTYSAWEIHDQIIGGNSVKTLLEMVHPFLITALVFKHGEKVESVFKHEEKVESPRVHFELGEVWELLPTLPHLSHLELYDNFVNMDRRTVLPRICLPSLLTLTIDCPMTHWVFFSFSHDLWLGLLTLLTSLDTPIIDAITLHGSVQRIKAAMMKASTRPSDLTLFISTFDEADDEPIFAEHCVWQGVRRVTVNLPETPESFSRLNMPDGLASIMQSLLTLLPKGTPKRFSGGAELDLLARSYPYSVENLDIFYAHSRTLDYNFKADNVTALAVRTSSGAEYRSHQLYAQWLESVEHIFCDSDIYDYTATKYFTAYFLHVSEPALKSWNSHNAALRADDWISPQRGCFPHLTTLRCIERIAIEFVRRFDTPSLHSITLVTDPNGDEIFDLLPETLLEYAFQLKQLKILGMENIPDWSILCNFLGKFRQGQREISTINLPGLPHPSILQPLVDALRGGSPVHAAAELHQKFNEKNEGEDDLCHRCFMNGFLCYDWEDCQRFAAWQMVSITKDTVVGHYQDEMTQNDEEHAEVRP